MKNIWRHGDTKGTRWGHPGGHPNSKNSTRGHHGHTPGGRGDTQGCHWGHLGSPLGAAPPLPTVPWGGRSQGPPRGGAQAQRPLAAPSLSPGGWSHGMRTRPFPTSPTHPFKPHPLRPPPI